MASKSDEELLAAKKLALDKAILDSELAAVKALKAITADVRVEAAVRLSAAHILLQARSERKPIDTTTTS